MRKKSDSFFMRCVKWKNYDKSDVFNVLFFYFRFVCHVAFIHFFSFFGFILSPLYDFYVMLCVVSSEMTKKRRLRLSLFMVQSAMIQTCVFLLCMVRYLLHILFVQLQPIINIMMFLFKWIYCLSSRLNLRQTTDCYTAQPCFSHYKKRI